MWRKIFLAAKRAVLIAILLLSFNALYGQNDPSTDRFLFVDLGDEEFAQRPVRSKFIYQQVDLIPILAVKTNLLFDLATAINVEVELPLDDRWSIAGEIVFPWWSVCEYSSRNVHSRLQLVNGTIEGKYWWGDRPSLPYLSGWFTGLYTGIGTYDVEWRTKGYQGSALFTLGVSGGYAHVINRAGNLRLEYTLGVGYLTTPYHYYEAELCENNHWHAIERRRGRLRWFGPTRAKVSLSWLIWSNKIR